MAILVVPDTIEITAYGTASGRPWASVWGMTNGAGEDVGEDPAVVVRDFANNWQDHIMLSLTSNVSLTGFRWLSLNSETGQTGEVLPDPGKRMIGANTDTPATVHTCLLIRKQATGGRGARSGRCYLPCPPEGIVGADGTIDPSFVSAINTNLSAFLSGISDTGAVDLTGNYPCIIRRPKEARIKGTQVVQGTQSRITGLTCDPKVATQRRRLRS